MIITVIATRFGEDGPSPAKKSFTADKKIAPPSEVAAPTSFSSNDDDAFTDIVSFFKK